MAVLKRRSKMISVRLSDREYQNLKALCAARGSRSLSDLARDAMNGLLENGNGSGSAEVSEVSRLNGRMTELESELKRLSKLMETVKRVVPDTAC